MRSAFWGALGVAALAITPALAQSDSDGPLDSVPKIEPGEVITLDPGASAGAETGKYRFVLDFQPAKDRETTLIKTLLEREGVFERVLDSLSDQIALPQDVPVVFEHYRQELVHGRPGRIGGGYLRRPDFFLHGEF